MGNLKPENNRTKILWSGWGGYQASPFALGGWPPPATMAPQGNAEPTTLLSKSFIIT